MLEKPGWGQNSSCWGILPRKPCPLQMPQWAFVAFLEMIKMLISISGLLWCFGCPDRVKRRFGLSSIIFCSSLDVVSIARNKQHHLSAVLYEDFFEAFGKWIGNWKSDIKQQRSSINVQRNCIMFLEATVWAFIWSSSLENSQFKLRAKSIPYIFLHLYIIVEITNPSTFPVILCNSKCTFFVHLKNKLFFFLQLKYSWFTMF